MSPTNHFSEAKQLVLHALTTGDYQHEARGDVDVKNLLATGQISPAAVMQLIKRCRGHEHTASPHHLDRTITVHVLKTGGWYIKFYFLDPDTWFISVHQ